MERWESLPARYQVALAYPVVLGLLAAVHLIFFPWLTVGRSLSYAVFEAVPLALVVVMATQVERGRRAAAAVERSERASRPASSDLETTGGGSEQSDRNRHSD